MVGILEKSQLLTFMSHTTSSLESEEQPSEEIKRLAEKLDSCRVHIRREGEQEIRAMGPEGVDILMALLRYEERRRRERKKDNWGRLLFSIVLFGGMALLFYFMNNSLKGTTFFVGQVMAAMASTLLGMFLVSTRAQRIAARLLADYGEVRTVGVLAEALEYRDKKTHRLAGVALKRLLPRLRAGEEELLNPQQRACLHRALKSQDTELVLCILTALQQIGDGCALAFVEPLALGEGTGHDSRVREAAQVCLPILRQRAEQERAMSTLLRAAEAPPPPSDTLLRPVMGSTTSDPQQLLRGSSSVD
jgi:hypothetical protein